MRIPSDRPSVRQTAINAAKMTKAPDASEKSKFAMNSTGAFSVAIVVE